MKKVISMLLSLCVVLTLSVTSFADSIFSDVKEGAWYYESVIIASNKGYMNGTGGNEFSPNAQMTRAMFVQLLSNYTENYAETDYKGKSNFTDVPAAWYAPAIEWAYQNNIVSGTAENTFSPGRSLTRQEMVTMLYNYAAITENDTEYSSLKFRTFTDRGNVSSWAMQAMGWAVDKGVIQGTSETELSPLRNTTRAQVATMIVNAENVLVKKSIPQPPLDPENPDENGNTEEPENNPEKKFRPTGRSAADADGGYYDYDLANMIMDEINAFRMENNLKELDYSLYLANLNDIRSREVAYVIQNDPGGPISGMKNSHTRPDGTKFSTVGFGVEMENNTRTGEYTDKIEHDESGCFIEVMVTVDQGDGTATHYKEKITVDEYLFRQAHAVVEGWYYSEGHRQNMMSSAANTSTISCYSVDGHIYVTQLLSLKPYYVLNSIS